MPTIAILRPALFVLFSLALLTACNRKRQELQVRADCKSPEVMACLQQYAFEEMDSRDIERLIVEGVDRCFSDDSKELAKQTRCLPLIVGKDRRFDDRLGLIHNCDDLCQYKKDLIQLLYAENIGLERCCERQGLTFRVWSAGGRYGGCGPPEYRYLLFTDKTRLNKYSLCND